MFNKPRGLHHDRKDFSTRGAGARNPHRATDNRGRFSPESRATNASTLALPRRLSRRPAARRSERSPRLACGGHPPGAWGVGMMAALHKSECPLAGGHVANHQSTENAPDCIAGTATCQDKAFQNLRAAFAIHGHSLRRTCASDGPASYFSTRWNLTRHLANLAEAREFFRRIGGAP